MSARKQNTLLQSLKTFVDPKTIPFLISQGVPRKLLPVGTLLLGMILAFFWAYAISPVVNTTAEPVHLGESWQKEYIKQAAWQYSAAFSMGLDPTGANVTAQLNALGDAPKIIQSLLTETPQTDPLFPRLVAIQPFAKDNPAQTAKVTSSLLNGNFTPVLCVLVLGLILGGAIIFNTIIPVSLIFKRKATGPSTVQQGLDADRRKIEEDAKKRLVEMDKAAAASPAAVDRGTPVGRYMSTYIMGDDMYDDSFSIETASGEFLGETGGGISKTIGVGDPKKVTAVEVWVFDKNDIRTVTKVLMSEHAFNDEAIRAELAPKGEAVLIQAGTSVLLETQTLTMEARIIDLAYGSGSLPPNSFFERCSVQISAWPKKGAAATPPPIPPAFGETGPTGPVQ